MPAAKKSSSATRSKKPGLYANIHAKRERIAHGSAEQMREPGAQGAPSAEAFEKAEQTAKTGRKTTRRAASKSAARKAPAKKAPAKTAPAKTASAKKASAKKAPRSKT